MALDVDSLDPVEQNRERRILAAYLRVELGGSYEKVGEALGVNAETVRRWTKRDDWDEMCKVAHARWVTEMRGKTQARLMAEIEKGDADQKTLRFAAERLIPEMAAPEQGPAGGTGVVIIGAAPAGVLRPASEDDDIEEADFSIEDTDLDQDDDGPADD